MILMHIVLFFIIIIIIIIIITCAPNVPRESREDVGYGYGDVRRHRHRGLPQQVGGGEGRRRGRGDDGKEQDGRGSLSPRSRRYARARLWRTAKTEEETGEEQSRPRVRGSASGR